MNRKNRRAVKDPDPNFFERLASLETDVGWLKNDIGEIKNKIKEIDQKIWYIITGIVISILITILTRIL
jgi:hypothetical protein